MKQELRLWIDGDWDAIEFSEFFYSLQSLSYYAISDMEYRFAPNQAGAMSVGSLRRRYATLNVSKIQYASPGFTDLAGFGAILSEIRQFLEFLITHISQREDRQLERKAKKLELLKAKIEIARELQNSDLSQTATKLIETDDVDSLFEAIYDGRLTKVEIRKVPDSLFPKDN